MKFNWYGQLPFLSIELNIDDTTITFDNVLIDSGSASSLFNVEKLYENGLGIKNTDVVCNMVGIGGAEQVFQREVKGALIADCHIGKPVVQFGEMDYGFQIDGLLGADILSSMSAVLDFHLETLTGKKPEPKKIRLEQEPLRK